MAGYLGNKSDMTVHHLAVMTSDCRIVEIKKQDKVYFVPDTIEQATTEKFSNVRIVLKIKNYCILMPFQKATIPLILEAASFGSA